MAYTSEGGKIMQFEMEELIPIVAELAETYTSRESSSITYEKAEQLMQAVLYTINELRFSDADYLVSACMNARQAYDLGYEILCRRVSGCREAYNRMIVDFDDYGNEFYYDTVVKGLPLFFLHYDARYDPQDHLLTLDYITRDFDTELTGIDQISVYLNSILEEQRYLKGFRREYVIDTLMRWNRGYRRLPVNVAEIVQKAEGQDGTGEELDRVCKH